jgi:hypothetical protein
LVLEPLLVSVHRDVSTYTVASKTILTYKRPANYFQQEFCTYTVLLRTATCVGTGGRPVITGGDLGDVVTMSGGGGSIHTGGGADRITVRTGGAGSVGGNTPVSAGDGNDKIDVADADSDETIRCGAGVDSVLADAVDVIASDCEQVTRVN